MEQIKERKLSGNTYLVRDFLREAGARWDSEEKAWYVSEERSADLQTAINNHMAELGNQKAAYKALEKENPESVIQESMELAGVWLGYMEKTLEEAQKWYPKGERKVEALRKKLKRLKTATEWIDQALWGLVLHYETLPVSHAKSKARPDEKLLGRLGLSDPKALAKGLSQWMEKRALAQGIAAEAKFSLSSIKELLSKNGNWHSEAEYQLELKRRQLDKLDMDSSWIDEELFQLVERYNEGKPLSRLSAPSPALLERLEVFGNGFR
ncbi:MAG: hypothetical protein M3Q07_22425 [Pseudobdellovibrionaceae bacterium]|nr:hypothetical protein [Pseudobdellovibrionaceae bacterium]